MPSVWILQQIALCGVAALLAQSLAFAWRANLFSLGHHGFYGIGAYAGALAAMTMPGLPGMAAMPVAILAGALAAAFVARVLHFGLGRLRGDYFAVATLIFAEIAMRSLASWNTVGGAIGFQLSDLWADDRAMRGLFFALVVVALNVLFFALMQTIGRSRQGLWIAAVRDDDLAAAASGVDVRALQAVVFTLSAAAAGAAGAALLHIVAVIVPSDFSFINGIIIAAYVVFGGARAGRTLVAAVSLYALFELVKLRFFNVFGRDFGQLMSDWSNVIWGLLLLTAAYLIAGRMRQRITRS